MPSFLAAKLLCDSITPLPPQSYEREKGGGRERNQYKHVSLSLATIFFFFCIFPPNISLFLVKLKELEHSSEGVTYLTGSPLTRNYLVIITIEIIWRLYVEEGLKPNHLWGLDNTASSCLPGFHLIFVRIIVIIYSSKQRQYHLSYSLFTEKKISFEWAHYILKLLPCGGMQTRHHFCKDLNPSRK